MTTPSDEHPDERDEPDAPLGFDPYRFGAPEHPVPPEYAPPGYRPPPATPSSAGGPPIPPATPSSAGGPPIPPATPSSAGGPPIPPATSSMPPAFQPAVELRKYGVPPPTTGRGAPRAGNGKAIAALVLGIASIVLCWLTILDLVPVVLAIVLGVLGRSEASRRPGHGGKGMATSGIACAVVGALLAVVVAVYAYSKIKDCLVYQHDSTKLQQCVNQKL